MTLSCRGFSKQTLDIRDNPFDSPPQHIIVQGITAILDYLEEIFDNQEEATEFGANKGRVRAMH